MYFILTIIDQVNILWEFCLKEIIYAYIVIVTSCLNTSYIMYYTYTI